MAYCPDCEFSYAEDVAADVRKHERLHEKFELAVERFGKLDTYEERSRIKAFASPIIHAEHWNVGRTYSTQEKFDAALLLFHAYFSRSVKARFSLSHPPFEKYVAMLLDQRHWTDDMDADVCQMLIERFGKAPGIPEGNTYYKP